jgi:hypothetical protein
MSGLSKCEAWEVCRTRVSVTLDPGASLFVDGNLCLG